MTSDPVKAKGEAALQHLTLQMLVQGCRISMWPSNAPEGQCDEYIGPRDYRDLTLIIELEYSSQLVLSKIANVAKLKPW